MNKTTITITIEEYEYLVSCKRRAESVRAVQSKYATKNREKMREYSRKYYQKRKEAKNEQNNHSN